VIAGFVSEFCISLIASESHAGMRRYLRETVDEGWIIDVSPEGFRPDVPSRLFPGVQQEICIGVFARYGARRNDVPAHIYHTAVTGNQQQKFEQLLALRIDDPAWQDCPAGWEQPFQPIEPGWKLYPKLADLFPWQHTGVNSNRNWVWAPNVATLRRRWSTLIHASSASKSALFKETDTCSLDRRCEALLGLPSGEQPVREERKEIPAMVRVAFRSFDRQYLIHDRRVIDRPRPELWQVLSETQIYVSEQHAHSFTQGTALTFSALVPNVDHFNARGGRVLPLYRDRKNREPNVAPGLLTTLSRLVGMQLNAEDLLAYIAAIVAHPIYTRRFRDKLTTPGIRVPISADAELWQEAIAIGSEVLWLHTYGER
jgi:hypothetical protein